jgi:hypothetical protein
MCTYYNGTDVFREADGAACLFNDTEGVCVQGVCVLIDTIHGLVSNGTLVPEWTTALSKVHLTRILDSQLVLECIFANFGRIEDDFQRRRVLAVDPLADRYTVYPLAPRSGLSWYTSTKSANLCRAYVDELREFVGYERTFVKVLANCRVHARTPSGCALVCSGRAQERLNTFTCAKHLGNQAALNFAQFI